uniref:ATP-binding cassette transporter subfamily G-like protein 11 n=1 Tax=Brachionus rotundiformis TaxID=96890 RepID=A0A7H9SMU2_9BILA|nr:ATP-binding cassette transporter subfamily G-like protein 11 [Brachionus rotundiformis]QNH67912.1 ATP-binding cassette transporter subfamily H-like protein 2 [Brachionus rotundiformis]
MMFQQGNHFYSHDYYGPLSNVIEDNQQKTTISWNINAWTKIKKSSIKSKFFPCQREEKYKQLLTNVIGIVKPGELCAIMGASGAGKTTLLNILNFRNNAKIETSASVKLNGIETDWGMISRYSGFVQQEDLFNGVLTVREHLTFVTMLKLANEYSREERYQRVDELIQQVNLVKSEDTFIGVGDKMKGLSGGEKRRLSYASEIVNLPSLLFCDEPTSGLDSSMAQSLVESMRKLANHGKTIVCTIHQPSSQIFEMFDTLILLTEGRLAYFGPRYHASNFFASIGYRIPNFYNPADYFIETLSISAKNKQNDLIRAEFIVDRFIKSEYYARIFNDIYFTESYPIYNDQDDMPKYSASYFSQFGWLFWRQMKLDIKNPFASMVTILQAIIVSIFLGLIFLRLDKNEIGAINRSGALFVIIMQSSFGFLFSVVNTFPADLTLVYRESKNRLYSITIYYLVKQLAEMPKYVLTATLFVTISYWMIGLNDSFGIFVQVLLTIVLSSQVAISCGLLLSAASASIEVAISLVAPVVMPLLIFSGFFLNDTSIPKYFVWLKYISWFFYTNEACNVFLWQDETNIPCSQVSDGDVCSAAGCISTGKEILQKYNFKQDRSEVVQIPAHMCDMSVHAFRVVVLCQKLLSSKAHDKAIRNCRVD